MLFMFLSRVIEKFFGHAEKSELIDLSEPESS